MPPIAGSRTCRAISCGRSCRPWWKPFESLIMALLGLDSTSKCAMFASLQVLWSLQLVLFRVVALGEGYKALDVVLLAAIAKLAITSVAVLERAATESLLPSWRLFALYFVPAALYATYDALMLPIMGYLDPGSYGILKQLQLVVTGAVHHKMGLSRMTRHRWTGVGIVMAAGMLRESKRWYTPTNAVYPMVGVQILCSSLAGVFTEYLLKGRKESVYVQSGCLYVHTIILCVCAGARIPPPAPYTVALVVVMAINGVLTAFFLRSLGSVVKVIAGAVNVIINTSIAYVLFSVGGYEVLPAAVLVAYGVFVYSTPASGASGALELEVVE